MVYRIGAVVIVGVLTAVTLLRGPMLAQPVEADPQIYDLKVSSDMSDKFEPTGDVGIEFSGDNHGVFVTFAYKDLATSSKVTRIVRFGGEDYNWDSKLYGELECCAPGGSGRYGFRVLKLTGKDGDLPGGAYEARIYLNGAEASVVGWGIKGAGGSGKDIPGAGSGNGNGNGNDNN